MTRTHRTVMALMLVALLLSTLTRPTQAQSASQENSKKTFTIMGHVGVAGVSMKGLPGDPITDENGAYSARVESGWSGVVTPMKEGYNFTPANRAIERLTQDRSGVDFTARARMVTITDQILLGDEPVPGVHITARPGDYSATTDARGRYTIRVPFGWTGELFLAREGFEFSPPSIYYDNVTEDVDLVGSGPAAAPPRPVLPTVALPESASDALIIPMTEVAPGEFAQIAEDMRVMLHILREKLSEPRMISGVLYDFGDFFGSSDRNVEALYIQDYGAVFMLKVDFPLSAPTQGQENAQADQQAVDPVWQRARDRLYSPPGGMMGFGSRLPQSRQADARSFEQLKQDLVDGLRHAANIRNIEPNEWVIVTVMGCREMASGGGYGGGMAGGYGGVTGGVSGYGGGGSFGGSAGGGFRMEARSQSGGSAAPRPVPPTQPATPTTVLTIQAKKADIDALADGRTDLEQFRQKVKVFTY